MSDFDPLQAVHEEIVALVTAEKLVRTSARNKDAIIDEATHERDALLIAAGLFKDLIAKAQARRRALQEAAEQKT